jgi:hypothetical protein
LESAKEIAEYAKFLKKKKSKSIPVTGSEGP